MNWRATIANSVWVGSNLPRWRVFRRALNRPAEAQWDLLRGMLARNADSAYGRAHGFGRVKNYFEFTRCVPLVTYEELAPWIERIREGEHGVLTAERVTHLIPTSGSTGARKLIPFTGGLQRQFDAAISAWVTDLAVGRPQILGGPAYWCITPPQKSPLAEPSAVPIGFADDASYLGGAKGWLVRSVMVRPEGLAEAQDLEEFRFRTLVGLLRERELRLISVWHPSFLSLLLDALPEYWERILARVHKERPGRARELERADPLRADTLWPKLAVISCWGDGAAEMPMGELRRRFTGGCVQAKGLLATEAVMTIPFAGGWPAAVNSHFFEFIDAEERVFRVQELQAGETYEVVVTTAGGLWRYRMGDQVRVEGFVGETPSLRFVGRVGNGSDLFGEKLSERFVAGVIREVLAASVVEARFALLAPESDAEGWRYILFLEGEIPMGMAERLDCALRENPNYDHCRELGQLQAAEVFMIKSGGYGAFAKRLVSEGKRLGEIKPVALSGSAGWMEIFQVEVLATTGTANM